jgi:hypothetical protein
MVLRTWPLLVKLLMKKPCSTTHHPAATLSHAPAMHALPSTVFLCQGDVAAMGCIHLWVLLIMPHSTGIRKWGLMGQQGGFAPGQHGCVPESWVEKHTCSPPPGIVV